MRKLAFILLLFVFSSGSVAFAQSSDYLRVPVSVLPEQFEVFAIDPVTEFEVFAIDPVTGMLPPDYSNQATFVLRNSFNAGLDLNALIFDGSYFTALKAAKAFKEYVGQELVSQERSVRDQVLPIFERK